MTWLVREQAERLSEEARTRELSAIRELLAAVRAAQACWQPEYDRQDAPYARLTKAADAVEAIVGKPNGVNQ